MKKALFESTNKGLYITIKMLFYEFYQYINVEKWPENIQIEKKKNLLYFGPCVDNNETSIKTRNIYFLLQT